MRTRIGVVTGSRADFGLLTPLIAGLKSDDHFSVTLFTTGMHLSKEFGSTVNQVETQFGKTVRVESLQQGNDALAVSQAMGQGTMGFAQALQDHPIDLMVVLGDRFEIFSAVQAALIARVPVAHLCGGDVTEGAFDEALRHSITKMSHLHFVSNKESAQRVRQLGEDPARIFNFGSPAIDLMKSISLLNKDTLQKEIDFEWRERNIMITLHPQTLGDLPTENLVENLTQALDQLGSEVGLIITGSNADTGGSLINQKLELFSSLAPERAFYMSLGQLKYWSALKIVDLVVGNSSSALYEAPTYGKPAINIGERQRGRLMPDSVLTCQEDTSSILAAINKGFEMDCSNVVNPYGDGNCCGRIIKQLKQFESFEPLIRKSFHDL